jgi:3-oxoacyl-[acyl-carrier-protein] synthase-3
MIAARIKAIAHSLPKAVVDNDELAALFPAWSTEKISRKLGIERRHVVGPDETSLDLAERACMNLFSVEALRPASMEALIFCTQSPDFILPPNSCLLHERLNLPDGIPVFDYNHGCCGYIYGLFLAKTLIESGQVANVLLINAETYSRYFSEQDMSVRTVFGDAATATFLQGEIADTPFLDNFVFHTDGSGAKNLLVPLSAQRGNSLPREFSNGPLLDGCRGLEHLYMNGPAIFEFAMKEVPRLSDTILAKAGMHAHEFDRVILHQANLYMLQCLRNVCGFDESAFLINMGEVGNTVSCSIPLVLEDAMGSEILHTGQRTLLIGFGVGYACAGCTAVI